MKNILILGGCGYIGSALFNFLQPKNKVDTVDLEWFGNYSNPNNNKVDFDSLTKETLSQYDVVILVAANSSVQLCKDLYSSFDNNVVKFIKLVEKLDKQKFIYASSSCVYTDNTTKLKFEGDLSTPLDGLTWTKNAIDQFMPLTDVEYYGLRFGSVNGYSPNMRLDLMVNSMTVSALKNKSVSVMNGEAHRPILSINDLCRAVDAIIDSTEDKRGVYNLASANYRIKEVGKAVASYMGVALLDKGNDFTYDFTMNSTKFKYAFGFEFKDDIHTIAASIVNHELNPNWQRRDSK